MFIARHARATTDRATMGDGRFRVDLPDGGVRGGAPLVVVCGWYGALDKHVLKYTDVMKSWGCATLRTIMPGHLVFSPLSAGRSAYARDLLAATRAAREEHNLTDAPLYFMFMSNGGCWLWASINDDGLMRPDGPFADLGAAAAGVVFDSCPAFMTLTSGAAVLSLGKPLLLRLLVPLLFYLAAVGMGVMSLLSVGSLAGIPPRVFWRAVRRAPRRRELYLFSDSDLLCDADKVAELIDERRRLDPEVPIEVVRWKVSRHCTHLVDAREEYERTLRAFLRA